MVFGLFYWTICKVVQLLYPVSIKVALHLRWLTSERFQNYETVKGGRIPSKNKFKTHKNNKLRWLPSDITSDITATHGVSDRSWFHWKIQETSLLALLKTALLVQSYILKISVSKEKSPNPQRL